MSKIIYDNQCNLKDLSDEGKQANEIEQQADVVNFLKGLSDRQREIIVLRIEGYTIKDIAKKIKINEKTIRREVEKVQEIYKNVH